MPQRKSESFIINWFMVEKKKLRLIQSKETSIVHLQEWIKIDVFIWYYTKVNYIIKILKIGLLSFLNKILIFCL